MQQGVRQTPRRYDLILIEFGSVIRRVFGTAGYSGRQGTLLKHKSLLQESMIARTKLVDVDHRTQTLHGVNPSGILSQGIFAFAHRRP